MEADTTRRRGRGEDGAIAVIAAVTMVVMIGMAAVVVDVGAVHVERRQLQNGADAAALAIAFQCAGGDCGDVDDTAQSFADANANDGSAAVDAVDLDGQRVDVTLSTRTADGGTAIRHFLAPMIGVDETAVSARSAAEWGGIANAGGNFPLAMSWCTFAQHTGGGIPSLEVEQTVYYLADSGTSCVSPSGHSIPGGFGWLSTDDGLCLASASIEDDQTPGKPGVSTPGDCGEPDFALLRNEVVLIPVFEEAGGSGSSGWFRIHGYAAFRVTGYRFACPSAYRWNDGGGACGSNTLRFVRGYFTEFVAVGDKQEIGGPSLGAWVVRLTR